MSNLSKTKKSYLSFGGHGVDVAVNRADDLDKLSLVHFSKKNAPTVLDLGSGAGGHSFRMVKIGVGVVAIDKYDFSKQFVNSKEELEFIFGDVTNLKNLVAGRTFTDAYMQRVLHYLNYRDALSLLKNLYEIVEDGLFISVMGIQSQAGIDYLGNDVDVRNRFFKLSPESINKYFIDEPVCLYSEIEFIDLLQEAGWGVDRCWISAFGNIKAVCKH